MFCRIPLCCWFFEFEESKVRSVWLIAGQETFSLRLCNDNLKGQPYHRVFSEDIETDSALWTEVYCRIFRGKMDVAIRNVCVFSKLSKNERVIFSPVFFFTRVQSGFLMKWKCVNCDENVGMNEVFSVSGCYWGLYKCEILQQNNHKHTNLWYYL